MAEQVLQSTFDHHRAHSRVATDNYIEDKHKEWGGEVISRERVYMDSGFWILLREVYLGRRNDRNLASLLSILRQKASNQNAICPISANTFLELLRQQDHSTRRATAQLVDELSGGACLVSREERVEREMTYWTYSYLGYKEPYSIEHIVWTKSAFAFGIDMFYNTGLDESDERAIQKTYVDRMWALPLANAVDTICENTHPDDVADEKCEYDAVARRINESKAEHIDDLNSFPKIYREEFLELIQTAIPVAVERLNQKRTHMTSQHQAIEQDFGDELEKHFLSVLSGEIKKTYDKTYGLLILARRA